MILTVDIGNTTVCVCGVEKREAEELYRAFGRAVCTLPEGWRGDIPRYSAQSWRQCPERTARPTKRRFGTH